MPIQLLGKRSQQVKVFFGLVAFKENAVHVLPLYKVSKSPKYRIRFSNHLG